MWKCEKCGAGSPEDCKCKEVKFKEIVVQKTEIHIEESPRFAVIHLKHGYFDKCEFKGVSAVYTFEDWDFIGYVATRIKQVSKNGPQAPGE